MSQFFGSFQFLNETINDNETGSKKAERICLSTNSIHQSLVEKAETFRI